MSSKSVETEISGLRFKGPVTATDQQILEAAILHFILKLPADERPSAGIEIDVSQWIRGIIPVNPKTI
jgi:hypothetical protein